MQNGWNIASCAKCYAPVAHDAPRCVRCQINYCSFTCRRGHDALADPSSSGDGAPAKRARAAPSTDVEVLSVKEMKALIKSAGLSSADCVEKSDLRKRTREALARLDEARRLKAKSTV